MESTGRKRIFERSFETKNLRYMNLYGDGNSKGFKTVEYIYGKNASGITKKMGGMSASEAMLKGAPW